MRDEDESNIQHGWADTEDREGKKSSHTPGPWVSTRPLWSITNIHTSDKLIATLSTFDGDADSSPEVLMAEMAANARLIVAAPKMYEALQKLARLGNEPHYGNSIGNQIAREALKGLED